MTFGSTFGRTFSPTFQPKSQAAAAAGGTVAVVAAADTWLKTGADGSKSYGGSTTLDALPALLRFDLSSIPSSATCTAAKITLTASITIFVNRVLTLYEIASANGDWVEGTSNAQAVTGVACWNYKAYHASTPTYWAGSAGCATADTDYVNTVLAQKTIATQLANGDAFEIPFNAAGLTVVQSWFGQSTNSGLRMIQNNITRWYSKENATESYRPTLTVTYS